MAGLQNGCTIPMCSGKIKHNSFEKGLDMNVRKSAVAGQFYPADTDECRQEIQDALPKTPITAPLPPRLAAAIVPHAGWVFSGDLAAMAFEAIRQVNGAVDTFVLFGAAHRYFNGGAVVYDSGAWKTPLGSAEIDEKLAAQIVDLGAHADLAAHRGEHSIEVQIPFIQYLFPNAKIVPILVPVAGFEYHLGTRIGQHLAKQKDRRVVCIASTDLTHYGPRYGFCPEGTGPAAIKWAHQVNDMEFIQLALQMEADKIVNNALDKGNACGPAAVATVVAAARAMGCTHGTLLAHTTSTDVLERRFHQTSEESVGYAAIVY